MRVLLTWSDRGVDLPIPSHHTRRSPEDEGPIARLLRANAEEGQPPYDLIFVLATDAGRRRARQLVTRLGSRAELVTTDIVDPSDHEALFMASLAVRDALPPACSLDILLSAGTPQAQTTWVVMTQAGLFAQKDRHVRMLQVIPPAFVPHIHPRPVREVRLNIAGFPEIRALRDEVAALRAELHRQVPELVSESESMKELLARLGRVAPTQIPVLLLGETGTGKERVAQALHRLSDRSAGPFVAENCGALAEGVLESELFGHAEGAFTGATRSRRGLFARAHGGTLFLDEVGELPLTVQVRLLRVLQEGMIRPVGSEDVTRVDVRIVAATHRDLPAMVRAGTFREDLWYRLAGIVLAVPPLRERQVDLPPLVEIFLKELNRSDLTILPSVWSRLATYAWPGNVRELRAEVVRWAAFAGTHVDESLLSQSIRIPMSTDDSIAVPPVASLAKQVEQVEKQAIRSALQEGKGIRGASRILDIDRNTIKRKMMRYGITYD